MEGIRPSYLAASCPNQNVKASFEGQIMSYFVISLLCISGQTAALYYAWRLSNILVGSGMRFIMVGLALMILRRITALLGLRALLQNKFDRLLIAIDSAVLPGLISIFLAVGFLHLFHSLEQSHRRVTEKLIRDA